MDIQEILKNHNLFLLGNGGCRADLTGANLTDADMTGANLPDFLSALKKVRSSHGRNLIAAG